MPTLPRATALIAALAAALACPTSPVLGAEEDVRVEPLWFDTVPSDGAPGRTVSALLDVPVGWVFGDAAAVMVSDGPWPGPARERLVAALLGEGAAVLKLDSAEARGFSPENAVTGPPATAGDLLPDVRGAADALRREAGAGLVVVLGHGAGGEAAVLAAGMEQTAAPDAADIAAAASLGPGPSHFAPGGADPGRGWPARAGVLCRVLAEEALRFEQGAEARCRRALAGPGEAQAARAARP